MLARGTGARGHGLQQITSASLRVYCLRGVRPQLANTLTAVMFQTKNGQDQHRKVVLVKWSFSRRQGGDVSYPV